MTFFRKTLQSNHEIRQRIERVTSAGGAELEAKRNARFGKLNVALAFDLSGHTRHREFVGDVRREFARRVAAGAL